MTRVWLTDWEWACCGDAFAVGDDVDLGIETRAPSAALAETLGGAIVATVDAIESHHETEFADRVRGRVVAVHTVTREVVERRSLRRPGHGAPPNAVMPSNGEEWPVTGREIGGGVSMGSRPSRFVIEIVPVPDTAVLEPADRVPLAVTAHDGGALAPVEAPSDPPDERRARTLVGWLVDVEERPHRS